MDTSTVYINIYISRDEKKANFVELDSVSIFLFWRFAKMRRIVSMKQCQDKFECVYLGECGECEAMGSECIGDLCESWKVCQNCQKKEECREHF